jgi:hypothetical protein
MKYLLTVLYTSIFFISAHVSAATLDIQQEEIAEQGTVVFTVSLDPQNDSINALAATFSYPTEYFSFVSVSTVGSVVPLWIVQPKLSKSVDFSGLSHISFEGVIPGGFDGIRSPYYEGVKPGNILQIALQPRKIGNPSVLLDNIDIRMHDGKATKVDVKEDVLAVSIEKNNIQSLSKKQAPKEIKNPNLSPYITQTDLVYDGAYVVMMQDDATQHSVDRYELAETSTYNPSNVSAYKWRTVSFPYKLLHQSRNTFTHIRAVYTDNTFAYATLPPVENSSSNLTMSRILVYVIIALSVILILRTIYARSPRYFRKKN